MSQPYVTNVTVQDGQIALTVQADEFEPDETIEISGNATQDSGGFASFYDIQPVTQNPDGNVIMHVRATPSQEFRKDRDVTVVLRAARVWATVLGAPQLEQGPSQELAELPPSQEQDEGAAEGTAWTVIKAMTMVPFMSHPYVTNVTVQDGQIVLTVQADEFEPDETIEISGNATQDSGGFASFYDIQPVTQNPDGNVVMHVRATPSQEFRKDRDVTVVLRAARVWATVLAAQLEQGPSQELAELPPSQEQDEGAAEGTAWTERKARTPATYAELFR
jgi:hypothetical protein